jgi:tRNA(adenine34) deaminase
MNTDEDWMREALVQARAAMDAGEVPVGAVLVKDGVVVATGRNTPVAAHDPTAHAEIMALRAAAAAIGNYRLDGCELFVTLEPCAMCAGAMLHARLARVVFGAHDPKTGAAGSVLDLFARSELNHRTLLRGNVLADASSLLLQTFFRHRREAARKASQPLRDDALRTPDERFALLPDFGVSARWAPGSPSQRGWRMHCIDTGPQDAAAAVLCLHAPGHWSYFFRHLLTMPHIRWLAPDLIGFGRSDKPKREAVHTWEWHRDVLLEWLGPLECVPLRIVCAPGAERLAVALTEAAPHLFVQGVDPIRWLDIPETPDALADLAWRAPFPDRGFEAGLRALGRAPATSSGPSPAQAVALAARLRQDAVIAMGYSRP